MKRFLFMLLAFVLCFTVSPAVSIASDHSPTEKAAVFKAAFDQHVDVAEDCQAVVAFDVGWQSKQANYIYFNIENSFAIGNILFCSPSIYRQEIRLTDFKIPLFGYTGLPTLAYRCQNFN